MYFLIRNLTQKLKKKILFYIYVSHISNLSRKMYQRSEAVIDDSGS